MSRGTAGAHLAPEAPSDAESHGTSASVGLHMVKVTEQPPCFCLNTFPHRLIDTHVPMNLSPEIVHDGR